MDTGDGAHDWWHIYRVWQLAMRIGRAEGADLYVVALAALLHDIADWKLNDGDEQRGMTRVESLLIENKAARPVIDAVCEIIATLSFKGAEVPSPMATLEGQVVQDADRLDAMGAMGIARAFSYGGLKHRHIHLPDELPQMHTTARDYMNNRGTTINHFYEKLLLLKDRMNTRTAMDMANHRHGFMEDFLEEFFQEWDGKK